MRSSKSPQDELAPGRTWMSGASGGPTNSLVALGEKQSSRHPTPAGLRPGEREDL
jgi:hypothetical protein